MTVERSLFAGVDQTEIRAAGLTLLAPGFYRDLHMMSAILLADLDAARALLPSDRLRPLTPLPGRALVAIGCFEYRDSPVGPYHEVAISVGVRVGGDRTPSLLAAAASAWTGTYHAYVVQLPVSTEISRRAGVEIFRYPKFLADIRFREDGRERTCEVRDPATGALIFAFAGDDLSAGRNRGRPAAPPRTMTAHSYPLHGDRPTRATMRIRPLEGRTAHLGRSFRITLGDHERSRPLAALRPGALLRYVHAPRCEAILHPPEPLPPER